MAISTFRTKRFRPIRLIGEPENRARNAGLEPGQLAELRSVQVSSPSQLSWEVGLANLFQGQTAKQSSHP